jgi:N-acetylmuramoyl-L-alanine amidase|tara:strand:- start:8513 stop:9604 length:1092 start_codon:yes stop_codon:yes gene_type:complete
MNSKRIQILSIFLLGIFLASNFHAQGSGNMLSAIKTVVIDPGHGGKDPGCLGSSTQEKIVCLAMALKLGDMIKKNYPDIKVVYTRDKDVFVELDDRAKIANKNNADLFICIHANAASASAVGTETYVLGLHRTESQQKIAERENSAIYLEDDKGEKYKDFDLSPDAIIARQIQLSVFLDQSISFATKLQTEFKSIGRYDRGVKQAGFIVLYKTTMPSVLIETGFLTNPTEQKFLMTEATQTLMSNSMFAAFEKYKNELEGILVQPNVKKEKSSSSKEIEFKVQIETSEKRVSLKDERFKGLDVSEYQQDKLYKYTAGVFVNDYSSANDYKNELRKLGFQHAFVVGFQGEERISLEKALKLAEK